jgi:hypothetical protein
VPTHALEILSHQYPQAKETDADSIIDTSVMRRIERAVLSKRCTRSDARSFLDLCQ